MGQLADEDLSTLFLSTQALAEMDKYLMNGKYVLKGSGKGRKTNSQTGQSN